jgi:hypothetical protein
VSSPAFRGEKKRVPLRRAAWIIGSARGKDCLLLANLSHGEAQLDLLGHDRLPEQFTLYLEDDPRCAHLVWRRRWRLGVMFDSGVPRAAA